jgi:hypothetical protein
MIGAERASSTTLAEALREHPETEILPGEVHDFMSPNYRPDAAERVSSRFERPDAKRHGFKCAEYLGRLEVAERLAVDLDMPDIVVSLRDPVARAVSAWYWRMRVGLAPVVPFDAAVDRLISGDYDGFEWRHASEILEFGLYGKLLDHWLSVFPRGKVHVVTDVELTNDPARCLGRLFSDLGLDPSFVPAAYSRKHNEGIYPIWRIRWLRVRNRWAWREDNDGLWRYERPVRLLPSVANAAVIGVDSVVLSRLSSRNTAPIDAEVETKLRGYYEADIAHTQELLGIDLSSWGQS